MNSFHRQTKSPAFHQKGEPHPPQQVAINVRALRHMACTERMTEVTRLTRPHFYSWNFFSMRASCMPSFPFHIFQTGICLLPQGSSLLPHVLLPGPQVGFVDLRRKFKQSNAQTASHTHLHFRPRPILSCPSFAINSRTSHFATQLEPLRSPSHLYSICSLLPQKFPISTQEPSHKMQQHPGHGPALQTGSTQVQSTEVS